MDGQTVEGTKEILEHQNEQPTKEDTHICREKEGERGRRTHTAAHRNE